MRLEYSFSGVINTDFVGYSKLLNFYNYCKKLKNCTIIINWDNLQMLDANWSAVMCGMIHRLKKDNGLKFFLDIGVLRGGLSIFWRNRFAKYILGSQKEPDDDRLSAIQLRAFSIEHVDKFVDYIRADLLQHRGLDIMRFRDKQRVNDSYLELFNNYEVHSETTEPIICCGQFFPSLGELKFTFVDLGVGFYRKIAEFTKNTDRIQTADAAISWAIRGGSTKSGAAGGSGLKKMLMYCRTSNSAMHIISDNCYYSIESQITTHRIQQPFVGTTVNLIFRYN
jgi:hypothetical protein